MPGEYRRDVGMGVNSLQRVVKAGPVLRQMLAPPRPFADDGGEKIERPEGVAAQVGLRGEPVGEELPMPMQPRARAGADALLDRLVVIGVRAPSLRIVDD